MGTKRSWQTKLIINVAKYLPLIGLTLPGVLTIILSLSVDLSECNKAMVTSFVQIISIIILLAYTLLLLCGYKLVKSKKLSLEVMKEWQFNSIINIGLFLLISIIFWNVETRSCNCIINFILYKSLFFLILSFSLFILSYFGVKNLSGGNKKSAPGWFIIGALIILSLTLFFFRNDILDSEVSKKIYNKYLKGEAPIYPCGDMKNIVNK